jgi:PAS domain S-box-containing protein
MYKLDGFDENWNEIDSRHRQAEYTNLPSGDYVFRVKGCNNDDLWNEEGASIRISVLPPWWETWWFRGGIFLLLIGLAFSGHRWRIRSIEKYNRQLEGQVAERTADLRETTRALRTLLSNLPGMAYRCRNDQKWTMEFVSKGCRAITGYRASSLIGNSEIAYVDLILPEDRETLWEEVQKTIQEKGVYKLIYRIHNKDGALRWLWEQGQGIYDDEGRLMALEGLILDITQRKNSEEERENLIQELQQALAEVKILRGFIPICANCKSIRDDAGYWRDIEQYIQDHSDAVFSHSICPKCVKELYPEFVDKIKPPSIPVSSDKDDE